jgi:hypothetical protein
VTAALPVAGSLLHPTTWPGWAEALLIGIASRLFASAILISALALHVPQPVGAGLRWHSPFLIWDAEWYQWIVTYGYHSTVVAQTPYGSGYYDFAFFPAWPLLLIALTLGGQLAIGTVAPVAANVIFVFAMVPIQRVLEGVGGRSYARFGLLLVAFGPAAYIYSLAYGEPLFLLFVGLFFLTSGPIRSGVLGALAQLVRLNGAALAVASLPDLLSPETRRRGIVAIIGVVVAFAAWWLWIAKLTGNLFGYMLGSPSWYSADSPTGAKTGIVSILNAPQNAAWISAVLILLLAIGTVSLIRRGELRLGFYCLGCLGTTWLVTWSTMPRLAGVAFPAFAAFAALLPNDRARWALVGLSVVTEVVLGAMAIAGSVVP